MTKTNAMRILDSAKIKYEVFTYDTKDGALDGVSVARKTGNDPDAVFKTLVTESPSRNNYVFVIPVGNELDLKLCAKACGEKSIAMIKQAKLLPLTGYVHGGCTVMGMKKPFPVYLDESALLLDKLIVSAGKVGMQLKLSVDDYIRITNAETADLTAK